MRNHTVLYRAWQNRGPIFLGLLVLSAVVGLSVAFSIHGRSLMNEELRERLRTMAAIAALQFPASDVDQIHTLDDIKKNVYVDMVRKLNDIRTQNADIRFIYILRPKTENEFEFVSDADSLYPTAIVDLNKDGVLNDEDQPAPPGTSYDVTDIPIIHKAMHYPVAIEEPYSDQWGTYMSGFAPIRDTKGNAIAVLGIDIDASRYAQLSNRILSPAAFIFILIGALGTASYIVLSIWRKRLDTWKRVDEERAGLLKLTFHQIGQPLTILKWSIESLRDSKVAVKKDADVMAHIERMEDVATRFDGIFTALHNADLVHEGILTYTSTVTSLSPVIEEVIQKLKFRYSKKQQIVNVNVSPNLTLSLDPTLIAGVIAELIGNAIDFSPNHSEITVHAFRTRAGVQVSVSDHGCGIPVGDLSRIFQEFSRASNAATAKPDGSGLGLYIARGIIEKAGGRMWIESQEGKGTTVSFTLPFQEK
jgi:signal transduction histidine kinase